MHIEGREGDVKANLGTGAMEGGHAMNAARMDFTADAKRAHTQCRYQAACACALWARVLLACVMALLLIRLWLCLGLLLGHP